MQFTNTSTDEQIARQKAAMKHIEAKRQYAIRNQGKFAQYGAYAYFYYTGSQVLSIHNGYYDEGGHYWIVTTDEYNGDYSDPVTSLAHAKEIAKNWGKS